MIVLEPFWTSSPMAYTDWLRPYFDQKRASFLNFIGNNLTNNFKFKLLLFIVVQVLNYSFKDTIYVTNFRKPNLTNFVAFHLNTFSHPHYLKLIYLMCLKTFFERPRNSERNEHRVVLENSEGVDYLPDLNNNLKTNFDKTQYDKKHINYKKLNLLSSIRCC